MRILILGNGNVGSHLANALSPLHDVLLLNARNFIARGNTFGTGTPTYGTKGKDLPDLVILAVKDDAVAATAERVAEILEEEAHSPNKFPVICHTSGSVSLETLRTATGNRFECGVFYPLQTFTKDAPMDYATIPMLLEASSTKALAMMRGAASFSGNVSEADSATRALLHIAAVFACNFSNHMCVCAEKFLEENGLDFDILRPLLAQTMLKLRHHKPSEVQTGPAARGDIAVMEKQAAAIPSPEMRTLYNMISKSILEKYRQ